MLAPTQRWMLEMMASCLSLKALLSPLGTITTWVLTCLVQMSCLRDSQEEPLL